MGHRISSCLILTGVIPLLLVLKSGTYEHDIYLHILCTNLMLSTIL